MMYSRSRITPRLLAALLLLATVDGNAQEDTNGDGIVNALIPVVVEIGEVAGAYGSRWTTEVWIHNGTANTLRAIQRNLADPDCPFPEQPCPPNAVAGETRRAILYSHQADWGTVLLFTKDDAPHITLSARLLELSRRAQPNGINLPVVWEDQYLRKPVQLLSVPTADTSRVALRVYDPRLQRGSTVIVDFLALNGDIIASTTMSPGNNILSEPVPAFAGINDLVAAFPALRAYDRFDIRLTPATPGMEYWAFAAVTDRDTQHVLLITPDKHQ
jgi:hypothetical protein